MAEKLNNFNPESKTKKPAVGLTPEMIQVLSKLWDQGVGHERSMVIAHLDFRSIRHYG